MMNGFSVNEPQDSGYSTLHNTTVDQQEIQRLYETMFNGGDFLMSCPPALGVQTVAETTSKTGSLRQDGLSSLPLRLCVDTEPVETTVLDSSSPLDGIPLTHLLYGVVELTSNSLPPEYAHYCGNNAVIVEVDEVSCHVCIEVCADSTRIKITNSRLLNLSTPIPGDTVRVIRGDAFAGSIGSVSARRDESQVIVKLESSASPIIIHVSDLVTIDTAVATQSNSTTSSPPTMGSVEDTNMSSDQSNQFSATYSTGWRVNSPIPPSPIDSVVSNHENSPSSSLIGTGGGVTSPCGNVWNSSVPSEPLANLTFSVSSESLGATSPSSNASSTNSASQHSLTPGCTIQQSDSYPGNFIRTENYQNATATGLVSGLTGTNSLPLSSQFTQHEINHSQSFTNPMNKPTSPSNLYPTLNVDTNMYSTQQSSTLNPQSGSYSGTHSQVGVSYPSLPSYSSATQNNTQLYPQHTTQTYPQQSQYTPVLFANTNNTTGYVYGYQPTAYQSVTPIYQSTGLALCTRTPQSFQCGTMGQTSSSLYPQLQCLNTQSPYTTRQQPNQNSASYLAARKKTQLPTSFQSSLYPKLPSSSLKQKPLQQQEPSPWDEFRMLVSSIHNNKVSSQKVSLEGVIDMAIKALCDREPPQQWYNPLAKSDDDMCGSDLSTESVQVSALCPLIRKRMEYPCRGLECTHLQCFDAKAYLRLALKRRSQLKGAAASQSCHPNNGWKCPTCGKVVSVNQLYIEKHLQKAIRAYSNSSELEFKGPGHWVPYVEKFQAPSNSVIDLTMDSDDDR